MSVAQYVVVEIAADGTLNVWGAFASEARADAAAKALEDAGADNATVHMLLTSATLTRELPDWRRVA